MWKAFYKKYLGLVSNQFHMWAFNRKLKNYQSRSLQGHWSNISSFQSFNFNNFFFSTSANYSWISTYRSYLHLWKINVVALSKHQHGKKHIQAHPCRPLSSGFLMLSLLTAKFNVSFTRLYWCLITKWKQPTKFQQRHTTRLAYLFAFSHTYLTKCRDKNVWCNVAKTWEQEWKIKCSSRKVLPLQEFLLN